MYMKKGDKFPEASKSKVSKGLKKYFKTHDVWNKGLKYGQYDEPAAKRFRKDKNYYLKELEKNASRRDKYKYDEWRIEEIRKRGEYYDEITGKGRPAKEWSKQEISYLKENYLKPRLEICKYLGRSWSSIGHKLGRLGLRKYNKWKK